MNYLITILMLSASLEIYAQSDWRKDADTVFDENKPIGERANVNRQMWMNGGWEDYMMNGREKNKNSQLGRRVEDKVANVGRIGGITVEQSDGTATTQSPKGRGRDVTKNNTNKGVSPSEVNTRIDAQRRQQQQDLEKRKEQERIKQEEMETKEYEYQMSTNASRYDRLQSEVENNAKKIHGLINKNITGTNVESDHIKSDKLVVSQSPKPKLADKINKPQLIVEDVIGLE
jgi:hypothetical protein